MWSLRANVTETEDRLGSCLLEIWMVVADGCKTGLETVVK